jgi:predicted DNA-binding transcriptional regulator AlpA
MKNTISKETSLLVKAQELAEMLSVSTRHIWRMKASGKLPRAIEIGNCVRGKLLDISIWLSMDCPSTKEFEAYQKARK